MRRGPFLLGVLIGTTLLGLLGLLRTPTESDGESFPTAESRSAPSNGARAPKIEKGEPSPTTPGSDNKQLVRDYLKELESLSLTSKSEALELVRSADDWFPTRGIHAEAREAMSITLLVDLERMPEARVQVRQFISRHPQSRYRPLVQGVTGIHPRPTRSDYLARSPSPSTNSSLHD